MQSVPPRRPSFIDELVLDDDHSPSTQSKIAAPLSVSEPERAVLVRAHDVAPIFELELPARVGARDHHHAHPLRQPDRIAAERVGARTLAHGGRIIYDVLAVANRRWWVVWIVMAWAAPLHARVDQKAIARGRVHFEMGREYYAQGHYDDAIREFQAGYELTGKPQFLINLGQSYRGKEDFAKACELYEKFLELAPPDDPDRREVARVLVEMRREAAKANPEPAAPAAPSVKETPPPAPAIVAQPPPKRSVAARHWWIFPVTAVVVAGVVLGAYFGTRPNDCASATLDCIR